jgi:beta-carotene/zeaxanthin 4-ketolase
MVSSKNSYSGLFVAFTIIGIWASSWCLLMSIDISQVNNLLLLPLIALQTFLYTGLFITAHDAMHGAVFPGNLKINNFVGALSVGLYALFDYKKLQEKHWLHHHNPASELDPDFHNSRHKNFFAWYFYFMLRYWSWTRLLSLMALYNVILFTLHLPEKNLTLFWVLPSILSSVQLFYFGTFTPHKEPNGGYKNVHCAQTNPLPTWLSFITCYHFGYHYEHHEHPNVPWWGLPEIYQKQREKVLGTQT